MQFRYGWNITNIPYMNWSNTEIYLNNKHSLFELAVAYRNEWKFWNSRKSQNLDKKTLKRVLKNEKNANKLWRLCFRAWKNNQFEG